MFIVNLKTCVYTYSLYIFTCFFFKVLGIEPRALPIGGSCSPTELFLSHFLFSLGKSSPESSPFPFVSILGLSFQLFFWQPHVPPTGCSLFQSGHSSAHISAQITCLLLLLSPMRYLTVLPPTLYLSLPPPPNIKNSLFSHSSLKLKLLSHLAMSNYPSHFFQIASKSHLSQKAS